MPSRSRGFTLIEILIAVVVLGVLLAVAVPGYVNSVSKSHRADAKVALTTAAQSMERYFTERNTYLGAQFGAAGAGVQVGGAASANGYYTMSFAAGGATNTSTGTYVLVATPAGTQAGDACGAYALDQNNNITSNYGGSSPSTPPPASCW